jgi:hypothetical protein
VLVDAAGAVGPAAVAERDPPALEVAEELLPLLFGGRPVFFAGPVAARNRNLRPLALMTAGIIVTARAAPQVAERAATERTHDQAASG